MATKRHLMRLNRIAQTAIIAGMLIAANVVAQRWFSRWDLTEKGEYSLSPATKKLLGGLEDRVVINVHFTRRLPPYLANLRRQVRDVLEEYRAFSRGRLEIEFADPGDDPATEQRLRALGIPKVQLEVLERDQFQLTSVYLGLALLHGGRQEVIPVIQDAANLEYELTAALLRLTSPGKKVVGWFGAPGGRPRRARRRPPAARTGPALRPAGDRGGRADEGSRRRRNPCRRGAALLARAGALRSRSIRHARRPGGLSCRSLRDSRGDSGGRSHRIRRARPARALRRQDRARCRRRTAPECPRRLLFGVHAVPHRLPLVAARARHGARSRASRQRPTRGHRAAVDEQPRAVPARRRRRHVDGPGAQFEGSVRGVRELRLLPAAAARGRPRPNRRRRPPADRSAHRALPELLARQAPAHGASRRRVPRSSVRRASRPRSSSSAHRGSRSPIFCGSSRRTARSCSTRSTG